MAPSKYHNNASLVCPLSIPLEGAEARAAEAVRAVTGWRGETVSVSTVCGGITNALFKVVLRCDDGAAPAEAGADPLLRTTLVRVYGANTEVLIDREADNQAFAALSVMGFAPTYHGRFETGRVEGFLPARPLLPEEMGLPTFRPLIARELRLMHSLAVEPVAPPCLFAKLRLWFDMAKGLSLDGVDGAAAAPPSPSKAQQLAALDLAGLWERELAEFLAAMDRESAVHPFLRATVFCHNDLLSGNILVRNDADVSSAEAAGRVRFIDYEYGGYNFRGFDFANHFCEHAGFDFDIENRFPTEGTMRAFVQEYVEAEVDGDCGGGAFDKAEVLGALEGIVDDLGKYVLASHLWWGFWSVLQARYSPIEFDFIGYARLRLAAYLYHKPAYFRFRGEGNGKVRGVFDGCVARLTHGKAGVEHHDGEVTVPNH